MSGKILSALDVSNMVYTAIIERNFPVERCGKLLPVHDVPHYTIIYKPEIMLVLEAVESEECGDWYIFYKPGKMPKIADVRINAENATAKLRQDLWFKKQRTEFSEWLNMP